MDSDSLNPAPTKTATLKRTSAVICRGSTGSSLVSKKIGIAASRKTVYTTKIPNIGVLCDSGGML